MSLHCLFSFTGRDVVAVVISSFSIRWKDTWFFDSRIQYFSICFFDVWIEVLFNKIWEGNKILLDFIPWCRCSEISFIIWLNFGRSLLSSCSEINSFTISVIPLPISKNSFAHPHWYLFRRKCESVWNDSFSSNSICEC